MKQHRLDGSEGIDPISIARSIGSGGRVIVQCADDRYSVPDLELLNQLAKTHGRSFEIRFYSHKSGDFDASILRCIPDAQCISMDCFAKISNIETLSEMRALAELSLGAFELEDADVLSYCNSQSLRVLSLGPTKRCNIDLRYLSMCTGLERLHTTGHVKNIATVCDLPALWSLFLSSIEKKDGIEFVSSIPKLKALHLFLGGRGSIAQVAAPQLESLEIFRVRGLEDLGDLGRFENLERLSIDDQTKLVEMKVGPNPRLAEMRINNCKNLRDIAGVGELAGLASLRIHKTAIDYDRLVAILSPRIPENFAFFTGKRSRDSEICRDLERRRSS